MVVAGVREHQRVALQEIKPLMSRFFPQTEGFPPKGGKGDVSMDDELKALLDGLRAELQEFRAETGAQFSAVRAQLNTVEYGILAVAQKVLAQAEVRELKSGMASRKKAAVG